MLRVAYLFERFPSFGQTFCYREVAELRRQGAEVTVFSIRRPTDEPAQDWDEEIVRRVAYLPDQAELVKEVNGAIRGGDLPQQATQMVKEWDRRSDFLRLYQAAYVGLRLQRADIQRVHAHFAGMAARTAYWIKQQLPFVATHPDRVCPTDRLIVLPDCGALCALFESATGRRPMAVPGKPAPMMIQAVLEQYSLAPHEAAIVGDRIYTDMRMARLAGAVGVLTLTGEAMMADVEACPTAERPDLVVADLEELGYVLQDVR